MMQYKSRIKQLSLVFICLFILITPVVANNEKTQRTVRVAITNTPYLSQKQADGTYEGIIIDYLNELTKYAGWKVEYVEGAANDFIKQLQNGEVDLMGGVFKNKDTEKIYDFASFNSGFTYGALITKQKNDQYVSMDSSSFKNIKVGVYSKATNRLSEFDDYCNKNNLTLDKVLYNDSRLLKEDLDVGKIDAILSNDMSCQEDEKILMNFTMTPLYFAVTKDNSVLLKELNNSLSTLQQVSPHFGERTYRKHVLSKRQTDLFTVEEKEFIKSQKTIKFAIVKDLNPSESWDQKNNKAVGIAPDLLNLISEKTGLSFEYISVNSLSEARDLLSSNKVDMTLRPTGSTIKENDFISTKSYLESQRVRVYNLNPKNPAKGVEALLEGYHEKPDNKDMYQLYQTMDECIQAVTDGDVESLVISSLLLKNYPTLRSNKRLFLSPIPNSMGPSLFLLQKNSSPLLISIFDKAIQSLTEEKIQEIVYQHTVSQTPITSFFSLYETYPTEVAWGVAGILFVAGFVAVLLLRLNKTRLRLERENNLQEESYKIVGNLSGEQIYFYDFITKKLTLPDTFSNALGITKTHTLKPHEMTKIQPLQKLLQIFLISDTDPKKTIEFSCKLEDGTEGWFRAVGTIIPNSNGEPIRGIGGLRSIQKEMHQLKQLEKQATTDYLTNLSNRQHCEHLIHENFNKNKKGTLLIIDIDYFKQINDKMGHDAGDHLLREFSLLLQKQFSNNDILGRWGGDEFIAYIQNITDKDIITKKLDYLCRIMNHEFVYGDQKILLSVSIGVAISDGTISYETLFKKADRALYHVKNSSRNSFYLSKDTE